MLYHIYTIPVELVLMLVFDEMNKIKRLQGKKERKIEKFPTRI